MNIKSVKRAILSFVKAKRRTLFFWGVLVVAALIVHLLIPHHWRFVYWGIVLVFIGSVALTGEWNTGKKLRAFVVVGGVVVGSTLTTHGWNVRDNHNQKKAILRAVAKEWLVNESRLIDIMRAHSKTNKKTFFLMPPPSSHQVHAALTSPLFSLKNTVDLAFLNCLIQYAAAIDMVSQNLNSLNSLSTIPARQGFVEQKLRNSFRKGGPIHDFFQKHREFEQKFRLSNPDVLELPGSPTYKPTIWNESTPADSNDEQLPEE
ncbi:MAG: hypothetical protein ACYSWP_24220 [Planctomycetota bacterium]|jgi:hypothetical protein